MQIKLIAFDLDGTLLDDEKQIPPLNLAALQKAAAAGILLVPATGRILKGLPDSLLQLGLFRYFIFSNGAEVYDMKEKRRIFSACIDPLLASELCGYMDGLPVLYDCYRGDRGYMTQWMRDEALRTIPNPHVRALISTLRSPVPELKAYLKNKGTGVQKLQLYILDHEQRMRALEELPKRFADLSFSTSMPFNIEVNAQNATKGQALRALCDALGLDIRQTMAFGDDTNDLDLLRMAGMGVAMENATPAVKAAADVITGTNNAAGFAAAVERFVL